MLDVEALQQALEDAWNSVRHWVLAWPETMQSLSMLIGVALATVVGLQAVWAVVRFLVLPDAARGAVRVVAAAMARAVHAGSPIATALLGAQASLRWPYPFRLRACARRIEEGRASTVVEAAIASRLLPEPCRATGAAAESVAPSALAGWLSGLAAERRSADWTRTGAFSIAILIAILLMSRLIAQFILPKWHEIAWDLGIAKTPRFEAFSTGITFVSDKWPYALLIALPMAWAAVVVAARWRWIRRQRMDRASIILAGTALGRSEATLARDLRASSSAMPMSIAAPALAETGSTGDFLRLCRACGWDAATPAALIAAVDRHQWREERIASAWRVARTALLPLVLAVPVAWFCVSMFGVLIDMIVALAEQAT